MTTEAQRAQVLLDLPGGPLGLQMRLERTGTGVVTLTGRGAGDGGTTSSLTQPLVEVLAVGHGHTLGNLRHTATAIGDRLRYVRHEVVDAPDAQLVHIDQRDDVTGLVVRSSLRAVRGARAVQSWTTVRNEGADTVHLQGVSSLMLGAPLGDRPVEDLVSVEGSSDWVGESRWATTPLRGQEGLVDLDLERHQHQDARGARAVVSQGSWSSGRRVPVGALTTRDGGPTVLWQVEHNGAWRVEIAERLRRDGQGAVVLGLLGPTDVDHGWLRSLAPGEEHVTVPVSVAWSDGGLAGAVAEMTEHRRHLRHDGVRRPHVVFNDYMNTLMGDPTTEKLLPLVDAAASVGAEYFCIDAGWYDDGGDWWDSVGLWEPSTTRFREGGLEAVVGRITAAGMVPGLWLEPEVVGVRSPLVDRLPDTAFLQRRGVRIVEHDRYLLDLRDPDAVKHLDTVVDRLVDQMGVGYFKFDYNVTPGVGADRDADSPGDGLLRQNRAQLDWIDRLRARHPGLVIENCASGAMRADYALLARLDLQSTSDQQDPLRYPPIAAGALVSILPEQAANWAYPQPDMTDEQIVFTMCTGLAGRLYLSGRLDHMDDAQRALVRDGVDLARSWGDALTRSTPVWPLGLPGWTDPWVAVGLRSGTETLVAVWWRGGGEREVELDLPDGAVQTAYPSPGRRDDTWEVARTGAGRARIRVGSDEPQARILRIAHPPTV